MVHKGNCKVVKLATNRESVSIVMQLKPHSCFNCKALPSGTESGRGLFAVHQQLGSRIPGHEKLPLCWYGSFGVGHYQKLLERLFLPQRTRFGDWTALLTGSLQTSCKRKKKGQFPPTQVKGTSMQPPSLQTDSVEWKSTDRTNVFVYGSGKQDCKSANPSTMMAGTGIGDHIAETDAFYYVKVLTIILLLQKQHLAPVIPQER